MLEQILAKFGDIQKKYPVLIILLVLTVSLFFGYYALRLETDSSFDVMFRDDSQAQMLKRLIDTEFGGTDVMFVLMKVNAETDDKTRIQDIRHPDVIKATADLTNSLKSETFVASAFSLSDLFYMIYGRLPATLEESKQMIDNMPEEIKSTYLPRFLSKDFIYQNVMISVSVQDTPGYVQLIEDNVREKIEQTPFPMGVTAQLTGMPVLMNRILNYLINDNLRTIVMALVGVFVVLWIYFRSWKIALFSIIPTTLTLVWLAGTMYLNDIRITVMTASVGAMIIGISVDYAIHLTHRYHENIKNGHEDATKDTVKGIGTALFASVMTTLAGFLAMLLGVSPNSQVQGTVLSYGVAFAFIISITILPPLMRLQRKFIYSKLDETLFKLGGNSRKGQSKKKSFIDSFLSYIAAVQVKAPVRVLIGAVIFTVLVIPGFTLVYLDTDGENWVPEGDDIVEGLNDVGYNFGGTSSMNLLFVLEGSTVGVYDEFAVHDLRDPRVIGPMDSLDSVITDLTWVDSVDSPTSLIRRYNNGRVPQDEHEIVNIISENADIRGNFNDDYSIAKYTLNFDLIDRDDYYELLKEVEGINFPKEVQIIPQGSIPEDIEFEQTMGNDTMLTTTIGFLLVILIASLFYKSIVNGLLAFIPIVFAIIWTVGMMGYIDLPFTVLTTGMLAILMGMGIDFSIHLMHSIKEKMEEHKNLEDAVPRALMSTGQAISVTTITTVVGFMALSFATLVNTMRLGWTLALGIGATFFACIVIVPAVLVIKYKNGDKK
ncbi:MMPL family transporter [Candidatus Woesearchaeota archaeon]|nr:MMPL family transporter [Candidatus Woesearchaeota archaeon]